MTPKLDHCYIPQHTLSEKSIQKRRNFFIWSPTLRLVGGLHLDERNPITVASLYRWLALLLKKRSQEFNLHAVQILPTDAIFRYLPQRAGDALSRDSQEYLKPGDIGVFLPGDSQSRFQYDICFTGMQVTYAEETALRPKRKDRNNMTQSFIEEVQTRDGYRCVLTGTSSTDAPLTVCWMVFPSSLQLGGYYEGPNSEPIRTDIRLYHTTSNAWTLRADLAELFINNKWGIDVGENFRVVFFGLYDDYSHLLPQVPSNLPLTGPICERLNEHFTRCLSYNILGGDIYDKYDGFDVKDYLEDLGCFDGDDLDPADPEWQTELGKEVWELRFRLRCEELQDRSSRYNDTQYSDDQ
ncbi:hypothetical protein SCP_0800260 [Sparassis crispa]|uniref:HNH nuclease domain-containing protein n=1 Tax=Sparassis crispa TaxID=139825 RepID=A0A401GTJ9_9APHY|nr:hypothetical protein SCP_0800260 [Sparassis crispa]GBE85509.1 hypothetical protein SCP_0800260 [Sparassis crispa]